MTSVLMKRLSITLLALGLSAAAAPTFAGIALNTIDLVARVTESGQHTFLTGPISCTPGERVTLHVTVTQRSTGAVGQGRTRFTCSGALQQWDVRVVNHSPVPFAEGTATAVALARTRVQGEPTDAHQWLVELSLEE
jgi:hypothetical protein